jgi:hypothetical protein
VERDNAGSNWDSRFYGPVGILVYGSHEFYPSSSKWHCEGAIKEIICYCVQPNLLQFSTVIIDSLEYNFFSAKVVRKKPFSQMKGGREQYS